MRYVVNIVTRLVINVNEDVDIQEVLSDLDYDFTSTQANIVDSEILDWDIQDSK